MRIAESERATPAEAYIVLSSGPIRHGAYPLAQIVPDAAAVVGGDKESIRIETPFEDVENAWALLRALRSALAPGGRVVLHSSRAHGRELAAHHVDMLLRLAGFEILSRVRSRAGTEYVGRAVPVASRPLSCSVIVPCRNEEGNIDALVSRVPEMGTHTELVFVDGNSTDGTAERIENQIASNPERSIRLLRQTENSGKAGAVFQGFDAAQGDVLMILDADMTVAPEDLPRFYYALSEGVARFANGTRFAYPMARGAMPGANHLGNQAFSRLFSWLIGDYITDTLCGTKALFSSDWPAIREARARFGGHDPWGDFDLLFGAHASGLEVRDVPIRYGARVAGESKMHPMQHGMVLARASAAGIGEFKLRRAGRTT